MLIPTGGARLELVATAIGIAAAGWSATFLSTALALRWEEAGVSLERHLRWVDALALLPFVAHLAAHAGLAITGAVFIETLFQYPGMGRLIFEAVGARAYPVIQGVFLVVAVVVLTANLLADWLNARLDPRLAEEVGR